MNILLQSFTTSQFYHRLGVSQHATICGTLN